MYQLGCLLILSSAFECITNVATYGGNSASHVAPWRRGCALSVIVVWASIDLGSEELGSDMHTSGSSTSHGCMRESVADDGRKRGRASQDTRVLQRHWNSETSTFWS